MKNILLSTIALTWLTACTNTVDRDGRDLALEAANKDKVIYCMDMLFNKHDLFGARSDCFGDSYIQHNPIAADGPDALFDLMPGLLEQFPELSIEIKRVVAEGDLVWVHYHNKTSPDALGLAVVDIFKLEDGKLVEHWDVVQPVPEISANNNTMF